MSPIYGLTDGSPSFSEIGRLRLGIPKSEATQNGKGPKEISYFRPDFRPSAVDAFNDFIRVYTDKPTRINFRLPLNEISRCWDAHYEVYNKTGLMGKSDGKRWLYLRNKTNELLVDRNGTPTSKTGFVDENGKEYLPFDPAMPVYRYKSKKGEDVAVYAEPTGRLNILIPELGRLNYVQIITHSVYNIARISDQLAGIKYIAETIGTTISMVPMVIIRELETISVSYGGKKHMEDHYLLHIEIRPDWAGAQFAMLDGIMPGVAALPTRTDFSNLPALPTGNDESELDEQNPYGADEDPESDPLAAFDPAAIEAAKSMTHKDGRRYADISPDELANMLGQCENALAENHMTESARASVTAKRDALHLLLSYHDALKVYNGA